MKLVRDKIPEIIEKDNRKPTIKIADDNEFKIALIEKLKEETNEFIESNNTEELADILEVIYAIGKHNNISPEELEEKRIKKAKERGSFDKKIILK